jgi:hypothetical protein
MPRLGPRSKSSAARRVSASGRYAVNRSQPTFRVDNGVLTFLIPHRFATLVAMVVKRPQRERRLSDKVRIAFHTACDEGAVEIAERLLSQLDQIIHHPWRLPAGFDRRRSESLTAPAERLMNLFLWRLDTSA